MDEKKSKLLLGADINLIKKNIKTLVKMGKKVIPRVPLIPGYTLNDQDIEKIIIFIKSLDLLEVHLLPFHQYGSNKYKLLNKEYKLKDVGLPSSETIDNVVNKMRNNGLKVIVGGL